MVGTLELVGTRVGVFDARAQRLLETIAPQAAIALENAAQVLERERALKAQIEQLRIEIDETKKARQVAEITETEYFQELQEKVEGMHKSSARR
jgi:GAF domain-containing protein